MTMCWTNDGAQLHRDIPEIAYVLGKEGGEIWTDFYAIPKDAPNKPAGYALLNYLMNPEVAVKEHLANGAPSTDARVNKLLPKEMLDNPILYPAADLSDTAGIRRGGNADRSGPRRTDGALQVGLSIGLKQTIDRRAHVRRHRGGFQCTATDFGIIS